MSQIYKRVTSGDLPPDVATRYITDNGTAIPAINQLNIFGGSGIETYADPDLDNSLFIKVQNSFTDQITTIGVETLDITTIPLTFEGTYTFEVRVSAYEINGTAGGGFSINGVIRSNAIVATLIGDSDGFIHTDVSLNAADVNIVASGINAVVQVTGVAGLTINWGAITVYVYRGT